MKKSIRHALIRALILCNDPLENIKSPLIACVASIIVFKLMVGLGLWITIISASLTCGITLILTGEIKHHDLTYARNILLGKENKQSNQEKLE